jgi:DNA-directed RNA polymerase subunit RPC12/RpoP
MKYFCSKCGKTTAYNLELPKFCSFCGRSFSNIQSNEAVSKETNKYLNDLKLNENINSRRVEDDILYNPDYEHSNEIPPEINIKNFKQIKPSFKINVYKNRGESFGSLIDNPSKPVEFTDNNFNNNQKTNEQILIEFQKEAGLSRKKE